MTKYELMMLVDPTLEDKDRDNLITEVKKELSEQKMTLDSEENLGKKDLAYEINKNKEGYYFLYQISCENPDAVKGMSNFFSLKPSVIRFMFVKK